MQSSLHRAAAHTPGNCKVLVKIDVEGGEVRVLNGLGNVEHFSSFAALLKILHLVPAYIRWLLENFDVELLDPRENALVRVEPPITASVDSAAENLHIHGIVATQGGCPPFKGRVFAGSGAEVFSGCERYANFVFDYFARTPSIRLVVVAGDWQRYEPQYEGDVLRQIAEILARRGGQMVFVSAVPNPYSDLPRLWAQKQFQAGHAITEMTVDRSREAEIIERGMQIAAIASQVRNVSVVDPFKALCDAKVCYTVKDGRALFKDTDHLSQDGAGLIAPELESAITQTYAALIQER
jgi:SGNH domain (fused to AT3 domains)